MKLTIHPAYARSEEPRTLITASNFFSPIATTSLVTRTEKFFDSECATRKELCFESISCKLREASEEKWEYCPESRDRLDPVVSEVEKTDVSCSNFSTHKEVEEGMNSNSFIPNEQNELAHNHEDQRESRTQKNANHSIKIEESPKSNLNATRVQNIVNENTPKKASTREFAKQLCEGKLNYYQILNIQPNATGKEIMRRFRKLSISVHPDRNPSPTATDNFQALQAIYETLRHPGKRFTYNCKQGLPKTLLRKQNVFNKDNTKL